MTTITAPPCPPGTDPRWWVHSAHACRCGNVMPYLMPEGFDWWPCNRCGGFMPVCHDVRDLPALFGPGALPMAAWSVTTAEVGP